MEKNHSYTLRDYFGVICRQKAVIFVSIIAVMAAVIIGLEMQTPVYEARVKMLVSASKQVESPYYKELLGGYRGSLPILTQSEIVRSNSVIELSVNALGLEKKSPDYEAKFCSRFKKPILLLAAERFRKKTKKLSKTELQTDIFRAAVTDLKNSIDVKPIRDTDMFTLNVRDYSAVGAALTANVVSRAYVIFDLEQQLAELKLKYGEKHSLVMQMKDNIAQMVERLNGMTISGVDAIGPASVKIIEQATVPRQPIGPTKTVIIGMSFFLSIVFGMILAFIFDYLDPTFKSPQDIERFLNVPFFGFVPRKKRGESSTVRSFKAPTRYAHALRYLSDRLFLVMKNKGLKSITMISAEKGEGVSTTIANLGSYIANVMRQKVLLIDANLRDPKLHDLFNINNSTGLADILCGKDNFENVIKQISHDLWLLPAGTTDLNPISLLDSPKMEEVLKMAKERYKIILVDSPALMGQADALLISSYRLSKRQWNSYEVKTQI